MRKGLKECVKIVSKQKDLKYIEVCCVKFLWWLDKIEKRVICGNKMKKDIIKQKDCLLVQDEIWKYWRKLNW